MMCGNESSSLRRSVRREAKFKRRLHQPKRPEAIGSQIYLREYASRESLPPATGKLAASRLSKRAFSRKQNANSGKAKPLEDSGFLQGRDECDERHAECCSIHFSRPFDRPLR